FPIIKTRNEVNNWRAAEGHINPISIHRFGDYPVSLNKIGEYYPMFELAVRYLLDEKGHRKTVSDVKLLYDALKKGESFSEAFESNMGINLAYYEDHFFELILGYL
ncbi:MAG: hypothetical protein ACFFCW_46840, partial [Candidatus Hodarchaeota archaeon]